MSTQHAVAPARLPDDWEEDLVGTDWHQRAIDTTYNGLTDVAEVERLPWHVGDQLTLVGWSPDRSQWRCLPDIMVHQDGGPEPPKDMVVLEDGPPVLMIEVASETTWQYDVDAARDKAAGYSGMGIRYYLSFDPTDTYLREPARGWRLTTDGAAPWEPESDGSYRCEALGISLRPDGSLLRVIDGAGRPVPTRAERLHELAEQSDRLVAQEAAQQTNEALAALHRENAALRAQIARLFGGHSPYGSGSTGEEGGR